MDNEKKNLYKVTRVAGHEFRIYLERDELGDMTPNYPDFEENPEYTDEGRPFLRVVDEGCERWQPLNEESERMEGCGGCKWLYLEHPPDAIGVCMNDERKRESNTK